MKKIFFAIFLLISFESNSQTNYAGSIKTTIKSTINLQNRISTTANKYFITNVSLSKKGTYILVQYETNGFESFFIIRIADDRVILNVDGDKEFKNGTYHYFVKLAISPNEEFVLGIFEGTKKHSGEIYKWNLQNKVCQSYTVKNEGDFGFNSDGSWIAIYNSKELEILETDNFSVIQSRKGYLASDIKFSKNNMYLAGKVPGSMKNIFTYNRTINVLNLFNGSIQHFGASDLIGNYEPNEFLLNDNNEEILGVQRQYPSNNIYIGFWNILTGNFESSVTFHETGHLYYISLSKEKKYLFSKNNEESNVYISDFKTGKRFLNSIEFGFPKIINKIKDVSYPFGNNNNEIIIIGIAKAIIYNIEISKDGSTNILVNNNDTIDKIKMKKPEIIWKMPVSENLVVQKNTYQIAACLQSSQKIEKIAISVNGKSFINKGIGIGDINSLDCKQKIIEDIDLLPGSNIVKVEVTNSAGTILSSRIIKYEPLIKHVEKPLIKEYRKALVIGNGNYIRSGFLPNTYNDADSMAAVLKELGFEVTLVKDATISKLNKTIDIFCDNITNNDVALVYYSGHGLQVDGLNYLVPIDENIQEKYDLLSQGYELNNKLIGKVMDKVRIGVFIIDACRNNPWSRSLNLGKDLITSRGLADINSYSNGSIVAYATEEGMKANDYAMINGKKSTNSPYTTSLLQFIRKPLSISDMFSKVRGALKKIDKSQKAEFKNNLDDAFYLNFKLQ